MSRGQKVLYLISALLSALLFFIGRDNITRFIEGVPARKVSVPMLEAELKSVKIHDGDKWVDGPASFDKNSLVVLKGYLHSELSPPEIVLFYRKNAPSAGWVESNVDSPNGDRIIKFCKDRVSLTIDADDRDHGDYYLRLAWTTNKISDSYCPEH